MPTYDFECDCGYKVTDLDKMDGDRVRTCPKCDNISLYRLIGSGAGVIFSSGFKDKNGESISFPKDGSPYYDRGLLKTFTSAREKKNYMDEHNIVAHGSSDAEWAKYEKQAVQEEKDKKGVKK